MAVVKLVSKTMHDVRGKGRVIKGTANIEAKPHSKRWISGHSQGQRLEDLHRFVNRVADF
jgi:hypothetical protein